MNKTEAEQRLTALHLGDVPIVEIGAVHRTVPNDWFAMAKLVRRKFISSLDEKDMEELSFFNLSKDQFMDMMTMKKLPENIALRWRIPIIYGGPLEPNNMFLCHNFPVSKDMDRFITEQTGAHSLWVPNPVKKIYVSAHMLGGGAGGNATSDRLSQIAAQMGSRT